MSELLLNFHFLRPHALWLLLPALLCTWLLHWYRSRDGDWAQAVAPELLVHLISGENRQRSRHGALFMLGVWCVGALAAAGPSWEQLPRPVLQKQDALVIAMDLSYSMLATDLTPSRSDRVRRKLLDLLQRREEGLSAMIAYAGDAHVVAPLTDDNRTIANLLPALDPTMMPLPGSNPAEAVLAALDLLDSAGIRSGRVLLVTDGIRDSEVEEIGAILGETSHRLAVLGVGTEVGAPIPVAGGFLKDDAGTIVVPTLEEEPLRQLAAQTGGQYRRMRVDDRDIDELLQGTSSLLDEENVLVDRQADEWQDMAHWLTLPLLLVCLLSFRRGWVYSAALCVLLPATDSRADTWDSLWLRTDQQGARALAAGDAERAAELFENPAWRGTAAWEGRDYETSAEAFSGADDADGWYNQGNALAAQGRIDEALAAYRRSLELQPDADDAQRNIEVLEMLREQQQDQQQQQGQQQPQGEQQDEDQRNSQPQEQQRSQDNGDEQSSTGQDQESAAGEQDRQQSDEPSGSDDKSDEGNEGEQQAQDGDAAERQQPLSPAIDTSAMQDALERDQALEQWLRRVPDDPSGLLREKFRYESRQRQRQGETRASSEIW